MPSHSEADMAALIGRLMPRTNRVLDSNPGIADNNITSRGSDLLWAVCALHGFLLLGVLMWTHTTNPRRRIFHYFSIAILLIATIYYYTMASNLGAAAVPVEFRVGNIPFRTRQVYYTRWIGYFVNFSLAWFALLLMSGVGWPSVLFTTGLTMLWATMFLVGAFVRSQYKWGFYVFALCIHALIAWQTMGTARGCARRLDRSAPDGMGTGVGRVFTMLAVWQLFLMLLYPISWGLSEGGNRITNDSEQIFYSILDVLSQGVFSIVLLVLTRSLDFDLLGLGSTEYGRVPDHDRLSEDVHDEKRSRSHAHAGSTATAAVTPHGGVVPITGRPSMTVPAHAA